MDEKKIQAWRISRLAEMAANEGGKAALGRKLGYRDGAFVGQMLRGERPVTEKTVLAAQKIPGYSTWFDVPADKETTQEIDLEDNPDYPAIRRVKFKLSAGVSGFSVDYQGGNGNPLVFRRDWYEKNGYTPTKLFATYVANGSMEPGLYDGDTVVVNTEQIEPKDGVVFAVNYEGELVIKRLVRDDGQWWLASDNPDQRRYPRKVCHEGVILIGEIVHKQSERI
jgi:phage repressor protein C with HTH and peptisase S24 domain